MYILRLALIVLMLKKIKVNKVKTDPTLLLLPESV